jgi:hypothetical protein
MERWYLADGGRIHHHLLLRVRPRAGRPYHLHERAAGCYRCRHRYLKPSFPFRLDNPRVGYHLDVLRHPIGERIVTFAMAPEFAAPQGQGHPPEESDFKGENGQQVGFDRRNESLFY